MPTLNTIALVTGASRGLGETLSRLLAGLGFDLIITARARQPLEAQATYLRGLGVAVTAVSGDVAEPDHRVQLIQTVDDYSGLNLLVNNASELGPSPLRRLDQLPLEAMRGVFEVNTFAPLALIQALLPYLKSRRGVVVNISSDAATGGYPGWGGYGASKAALDLISKTLAGELAESGVSVVSVDPGDMRTKMHQLAFPDEDISDRPLPDSTLPFWAWLLSQEPGTISGGRFEAQSQNWEVGLEVAK